MDNNHCLFLVMFLAGIVAKFCASDLTAIGWFWPGSRFLLSELCWCSFQKLEVKPHIRLTYIKRDPVMEQGEIFQRLFHSGAGFS